MSRPVVLRTPEEIARWRPARTLGLVPTMGALHEGHATLIQRAVTECDAVIVSIFVNPAQFDDPADLGRYPRPFERDVAVAGQHGAAAIYAPSIGTMYPAGHTTTVHVSGITERWEGEHRPGHFDGVATVVTVLLNQVRPDHSYFGEKDWQQLAMIRRMARDLALPGVIVGCPLVRDDGGLALSSRNERLTSEDRCDALTIPHILYTLKRLIERGERSVPALLAAVNPTLQAEPTIQIEYLAIVDPDTLEPLEMIDGPARALIAAWVGTTRLIDTMDLSVSTDMDT